MTGTLISERYELTDLLSDGANDEIYRAIDLHDGQSVAVKMLTPKSATDDEFRARFEREVAVLRRFKHRHVVQTLDSGVSEDGLPFVVMELVEGRSLADIVHEDGPMDPHRVAKLLHQVASVLDAAHELRVIHRDIKPSNLLVTTDESGEECLKVLDFGFAKLTESDSGAASANVTMNGFVVGTPTYMSPEQAMGHPVSRASDIYSLGVTLFSVLTGRVPFDSDDPIKVMLAHVSEPIPRFHERNKSVKLSPHIESVVRRAMGKEPRDRPATAAALAKLFQFAVDNPEVVPLDMTALAKGKTAGKAIPLNTMAAKGLPTVVRLSAMAFIAIALGVVLALLVNR